jgi:prefoldin subunit 5
MPSLLENLQSSLEQTKERLNLLKSKGTEALNILYPGMDYSSELYYRLLEALPIEIEQLEMRIKELSKSY